MDLKNIKFRLTQAKKILSYLFFFAQYYSKKLFFQIRQRGPLLRRLHLDSFPAIHLKKMDWMDFTFKFSGELLVLVLAFAVAGLNLFYFSAPSSEGRFKDSSLATDFLNRHTELNPKLYAKNSQVVTMVSSGGLIPRALADDFTGLDNLTLAAYASSEEESFGAGNEHAIVAANPDSVQGLIEKQITVYQTVSGDTLSSIAKKFGVSQQTIIWANNLPGTAIKPGWYLVILPVDGIAVKANINDTLPDIAAKYNPQRYNNDKKVRDAALDELLDRIISYNALENAEDIDGGQVVIVPGGVVAQPPTPKPVPKPKPIAGSGASDVITSVNNDGYDGAGHIFPKGYCTWYVATRTKITFGGNAKNWLANARASGYVTGQEAAPNSVVVTTDNARYGHVAYVERVTDTAIFISEMNYVGFNKTSQRWLPKNSKTIRGYIYP